MGHTKGLMTAFFSVCILSNLVIKHTYCIDHDHMQHLCSGLVLSLHVTAKLH